MRAAVFHGSGKPLAVESVPQPQPGAGEVRVAVTACGFCHTDLHYLDHGVATAKAPPLILGHETAGRVESVGTGVDRAWLGRPVLLPAVLPCGSCDWCRTGRENVCPDLRMYGNHIDGGFAEFTLAPARDLVPLPPDVDPAEGCVIADALSTPYHAVVQRGQVRAGEWVAVVGCGGVGMNLVQFAAASGGQVVAIDVKDAKLALAKKLGAVETVNAASVPDAAKAVKKLTNGGVHAAFEAVGSPATINLAAGTIRRGGRLVLVGYSEKPTEFSAARLMFFEQTVMGSLGCRPADYPRVIDLVRRGRVQLKPIVTGRVALEDIETAANALRKGEGLRTIVHP